MFHLIGALSEFGKLGTVCIGDSRVSAEKFYHDTIAILDRETQQHELQEETPEKKSSELLDT
jgi:hypothetical protein